MALNYAGPVEFDDPSNADVTPGGVMSQPQEQSQAAYEAARAEHERRLRAQQNVPINPYTGQPDPNYGYGDSTANPGFRPQARGGAQRRLHRLQPALAGQLVTTAT